MMARMLSQLPLPLLPAGAAEIAPGVGLLAGEDGGLVAVHGLATFAWDAGDEAGRRLAAVQLVRLRAASQGQVAEAFGVDPATLWRWDQAVASAGVAGLVPARRGPKGASKLTSALAARIVELDAAGKTLRQVAAATGVSTFTVRSALGRVRPGGQDSVPGRRDSETAAEGEPLPVLPDPVSRDGERVLARWGLLGEGAEPVFAAGARYPLAGLLLALPALEVTGLLEAARQVYGRLRDGYYGLAATLLTLVFLALAGEPRAEGATRVPPAALGRVLGLDRAPEVKTIRRKLGELAAAGKAADLIMALARRHAAARPRRWVSPAIDHQSQQRSADSHHGYKHGDRFQRVGDRESAIEDADAFLAQRAIRGDRRGFAGNRRFYFMPPDLERSSGFQINGDGGRGGSGKYLSRVARSTKTIPRSLE